MEQMHNITQVIIPFKRLPVQITEQWIDKHWPTISNSQVIVMQEHRPGPGMDQARPQLPGKLI